jgi:outer membrane receptor protein involved in Fe transport
VSHLGPSNPLLNDSRIKRPIDQSAIFGEVSYDFTDQLEFTLGARRFDYEREKERRARGAFGTADTLIAVEEKGTNLKANLSYQPHDETLVYAQWSEGFRLGDASTFLPDSLCDIDNNDILDGTSTPITDRFESDTLESFELGLKLSAMDNRLQFNAAIYQSDWMDIPLRIAPGKLDTQPQQTCFDAVVTNAGDARTRGFEIESNYQATENLKINFGGSYINAELISVDVDVPFNVGDRLPSSPEYNLNIGFEYDVYLDGKPSYLIADYAYVGEFYNLVGEEGGVGGGYGQINLSSGFDLNESLSLELFVHNLTDADDIINVGVLYPDTRAFRLRPRTVGLNIGYRF